MSSGVFVDSCLFIDHMRAKDKTNTFLAEVLRRYAEPCISSIVEYEVELGMTENHRELWNSILECSTVCPFGRSAALIACEIKRRLKIKGRQIDIADLFIAATAIGGGLPLATLNRKHFEQIDGLKLVVPE